MTNHEIGPETCRVGPKTVLLATRNLSASESLAVRFHLITCRECRNQLKVHRTIHGALVGIDGPTLGPNSIGQASTRVKVTVAGLALAAIVAAGWLYTSWILSENSARLPASALGNTADSEGKDRSKARGSEDSSLERCE